MSRVRRAAGDGGGHVATMASAARAKSRRGGRWTSRAEADVTWSVPLAEDPAVNSYGRCHRPRGRGRLCRPTTTGRGRRQFAGDDGHRERALICPTTTSHGPSAEHRRDPQSTETRSELPAARSPIRRSRRRGVDLDAEAVSLEEPARRCVMMGEVVQSEPVDEIRSESMSAFLGPRRRCGQPLRWRFGPVRVNGPHCSIVYERMFRAVNAPSSP